jgi:hypothetical protein
MKKHFLFFFVFTILSLFSYAQEETEDDSLFYRVKPAAEGKYKLGVCLGVQASVLSGGESSKALPLIGIMGGTYFRFNFKKRFTLQPSLLIGFKGSRFNRTEPEYYNSLKLLYTELPIQLFYSYQAQKQNQIGLGVYVSELVNGNLSSNGGSFLSNQNNLPIYNNDWGLLASWQLKFTYFSLQTSYKIGLKNINTGKPWPQGDNASVIKPINGAGSFYNQTISLQLNF